MIKPLMLLSCVVALSACNESDSHDVNTSKLILDANLLVEANTAKITASLSKEKSSVVIVLNGGDFLQVSDGPNKAVMGKESNVFFGDYYQATLPLNLANTYQVIFHRAAQEQKFTSTFPAIPPAFSLVYPLHQQKLSVSANPTLNVQWDSKINSDKLWLRGGYRCLWTANPAVFDTQSQTTKTELNNGQDIDILLSNNEREARTRTLSMQTAINIMTDELKANYAGAKLTFKDCQLDIELVAKNYRAAHPEFASNSELQSIRKYPIRVTLTP